MKEYKNIYTLDNKTVLINGGMGTIGKEITKLMLYLKANLIIIDKNKLETKKFIKEYNSYKKNFEIFETDSSNIKQLNTLTNKIFKKDKIDIFINSVYPKDKHWADNSFEKIKHKSLLKNVEINTISYVWFPKIVADHMAQNKTKGSIIQISSIYGLVAQNNQIYKNTNLSNNLTYSFVKGGMSNYVKQMASYYGKYNIRVNNVCPGGLKGKIAGKNISQNKKFLQNYLHDNPINRMCSPFDVANIVAFLSFDSSSYITGQNIVVDGGRTII